jgi:hypothetical protein
MLRLNRASNLAVFLASRRLQFNLNKRLAASMANKAANLWGSKQDLRVSKHANRISSTSGLPPSPRQIAETIDDFPLPFGPKTKLNDCSSQRKFHPGRNVRVHNRIPRTNTLKNPLSARGQCFQREIQRHR